MDKKYLMGTDDRLSRSETQNSKDTYLNSSLKTNLLKLCIQEAFNFYDSFFGIRRQELNLDKLVNEYELELEDALLLGLLKMGGIQEKDHVNLWCLGRVLCPQLYIESGVYRGSSLHAFLRVPTLTKMIAIDPDLNHLRIPKERCANTEFVEDKDFSQLKIRNTNENTLAYFDDHINSAQRIIQAYEKGIKYLLFDDSTGLEGVCQRLYPAIPTVPMIMKWESFSVADEISWIVGNSYRTEGSLKRLLKKYIRGQSANPISIQLKIDQALLDECKWAKSLVKKYSKILDLGEYIPQRFPSETVDTTKYLIELDI